MSSVNVLHILRTIKDRGSVSRTDLQHLTGLSWGTITNTTRELLNRNLIREEGALSTKSGRKPVKLAINPTSHCLVGVDVAPESIHCLVLNLAGDTLWWEEAAGAAGQPPDAVLERLADMLTRALAHSDVSSRICLGIGVSLPGALDVKRGILRFAPRLPGWRDVPVRDYLQGRLNTTVRIEHDPNCLALAERWFGEAGHAENVLCIHMGMGVGMGILLGGEIFRGSQQMAGEFGHTTLDPNGPPCACGDHGCVESYCCLAAVISHAQTTAPAGSDASKVQTMEDLVVLAKKNDPTALETFTRVGTYLGIGLSNLIDLFNPDMIVLSGTTAQGSPYFLPVLDREITKHAWRHSSCQLLVSRLGHRANVMGACGMSLQAAFAQDVLPDVISA
jgi:predicted NBD/HSP70 family sugar kinase